MTTPDHEKSAHDDHRGASGYFRRELDDFHREANVLAGHDPRDVTSDPPENLRARRLVVFAIIAVIGLLAGGIAVGLMALPQCENPQYNWMPCVADF